MFSTGNDPNKIKVNINYICSIYVRTQSKCRIWLGNKSESGYLTHKRRWDININTLHTGINTLFSGHLNRLQKYYEEAKAHPGL